VYKRVRLSPGLSLSRPFGPQRLNACTRPAIHTAIPLPIWTSGRSGPCSRRFYEAPGFAKPFRSRRIDQYPLSGHVEPWRRGVRVPRVTLGAAPPSTRNAGCSPIWPPSCRSRSAPPLARIGSLSLESHAIQVETCLAQADEQLRRGLVRERLGGELADCLRGLLVGHSLSFEHGRGLVHGTRLVGILNEERELPGAFAECRDLVNKLKTEKGYGK
jgi:hypothetical protein